eukprot:403346255
MSRITTQGQQIRNGVPVALLQCFNCSEEGHMSRECPNKGDKLQKKYQQIPAAQITSTSSSNNNNITQPLLQKQNSTNNSVFIIDQIQQQTSESNNEQQKYKSAIGWATDDGWNDEKDSTRL